MMDDFKKDADVVWPIPGDGKQQEARCEDKLQEDGSIYRCELSVGHDGPHENGNWLWHNEIASQPSQQEEHVESKYQAFSDWYANRAQARI